MRLLLTVLIVISTGTALVLGLSMMIFGIAFSSHPIKGSPDAPFWSHLRLGLIWGAMFAGVPAVIAIALTVIRRRLPPD